MQLRPRHFVLFALVIGLFLINIFRNRRKAPVISPTPAPVVSMPRSTAPAWTAFDHAASLRDAPDAQFQPALQSLQQQIANVSPQGLEGCLTWLEFYRQGVLHPARDPQWKARSDRHLNGCVQYHADVSG